MKVAGLAAGAAYIVVAAAAVVDCERVVDFELPIQLSCSGNLCRHVYPSEDLLAENGDAEAQRTLVPSYYVVLA